MSTTSIQLKRWMRKLRNFRGVFALDEMPHLLSGEHNLIVNLDTRNLPGSHWVAIHIQHANAYYFDSQHLSEPHPMLYHHLLKYCNVKQIYTWRFAVQPKNSKLCGPHCVYFLYHGMPACSERDVIRFIKTL